MQAQLRAGFGFGFRHGGFRFRCWGSCFRVKGVQGKGEGFEIQASGVWNSRL